MKTTRRFAPLALVLGLLAGCAADSHESLADETMDLMEEAVSIIESVEDEASAKAASEKLTDLAGEMRSVSERLKELGKPTEEQDKALEEKFGERRDALLGRMLKAQMKAAKYREQLDEGMEAFGNATELK